MKQQHTVHLYGTQHTAYGTLLPATLPYLVFIFCKIAVSGLHVCITTDEVTILFAPRRPGPACVQCATDITRSMLLRCSGT